ncbi:hypothetical protein Z043_106765, partial [Scleropages formosus]
GGHLGVLAVDEQFLASCTYLRYPEEIQDGLAVQAFFTALAPEHLGQHMSPTAPESLEGAMAKTEHVKGTLGYSGKHTHCCLVPRGGVVKTPHPVCLIENTNENGLNLNRQAMDILSSITKPVVVAEVVGKFPTGDSYLANRLFGQCTGCHNHSESSDIWMWCVPYPHIKDSTLVLLDKGKGDPVVMAHPVCLIENIEENKVKINQEALAILSSISQPVVVVSIVGKYRTGKSYLMNRLAGKRTGFSLGSTVQSNTKGIWMLCVPHPRREGQTLVLLDTEGLGDVEKDDLRYDSYVFTLAILLSSTLVYNTKGTIDNEELLRLHRKCFVFYQPTNRNHHNLEKLNDTDLDPDFVKQTNEFCSYIFDSSKEKTIAGGTCIQKEYERKCQENEQLSYKHCTDLLEKLWGNIDHKSYMRPGGYLDYRATVDGIIKKYKATPQKGLKAEEALQTFLKQKEDMESCILKADHSLTEQQKKLE